MKHYLWLAVLMLVGEVHAHVVLLDSWLALDAAAVKQNVEASVQLHFGSGMEPHGTTVDLVPEHGDARPLRIVFGPGPGDVAVTLPRLEGGRYALRYHVLATDGHVTEGTFSLRVVEP